MKQEINKGDFYMSTCKNCGRYIDDNAKFCNYCGTRQEDNSTETVEKEHVNSKVENTVNSTEHYQYQNNTNYYRQKTTDPFAITSLVLSLVGIVLSWFILAIPSILGIIFAIISMNRCKKQGYEGYGMAMAGLIISIIIAAIYFIIVVMALSLIGTTISTIGT